MTEVLLVCDRSGTFLSCRAEGHAAFAPRGSDIVCAAETIVLRTSMDMLEQTEGVVLTADASIRGCLEFRVEHFPVSAVERLRCIGDFIRISFSRLSAEYPDNVHFQEICED